MCEQTEVRYLDGDVVWVKLGSSWWPGRVKDVDQLPEEILTALKKRPIAAVQFFQEDTYEYVKNLNQICMYNCRRKNEFIKKGLDIYRSRLREGSTVMDKFPQDIVTAEKLTGGDPNILKSKEFAPEEKTDYRDIFGGDKKTGPGDKKNSRNSSSPKLSWKVKPLTSSANGRRSLPVSSSLTRQPRQITHPRFITDEKDDNDHVRIRHQPLSIPSRDEQDGTPAPYKCHVCDFTSTRLNVIVLHTKFHSSDSAVNSRGNNVRGGSAGKSKSIESKVSGKSKGKVSYAGASEKPRAKSKSLPSTPKASKSETERSAPKRKVIDISPSTTKEGSDSKTQPVKSPTKQAKILEKKSPKSPKTPIFGKRKHAKVSGDRPTKKRKSDEEIREKLLADWDDEDEEQEEKEIEKIKQELSKKEVSSPSPTPVSQSSSVCKAPETKEETVKRKEISCFDFDDAEDANLGTELEERAKKFQENRKIPKIVDENKRRSVTEEIKPIPPAETSSFKTSKPKTTITNQIPKGESKEQKLEEVESAAVDVDLEVAFKNLLDETTVPTLPEVPELPITKADSPDPNAGTSASLPDVVLDSNNSQAIHEEHNTPPSSPEATIAEVHETLIPPHSIPEEMTLEDSGKIHEHVEEKESMETDDKPKDEPSKMEDTADKSLKEENTNGESSIVNALPTDPPNALPAYPINALPADPTNSLPADSPNALPSNPSNALPSDPTNVLPVDPPNALPSDPTNAQPADPTNILPSNLTNALPTDPTNALPAGLTPTNVTPVDMSSASVTPAEIAPASATATTAIEDDEMELDINSMPVVMTDAIITEEPELKIKADPLPLIDLVPKREPHSDHTFVVNESLATSSVVVTTTNVVSASPSSSSGVVVSVSKNNLIVSQQLPSSSGSPVIKAPIKTVKLQAPGSGTTINVPSSALSTISKLKGPGGSSKVVIVQAPVGQQSRFTVGKTTHQRLAVKGTQQQILQQAVGGKKVMILTNPQGSSQQKIITTALSPQQQKFFSGKLQGQPQQCIISSTGAILTPITSRSVMAKGTKLTPITQQQMKALQSGKQGLGAKFTMQSTQAKVILPSMQKASGAASSPVRVIGTLKPQSNTILLQTTQGTSAVSGTVVSRAIAASSGQIQTKINATQSLARIQSSKPKILATPGTASTVQRITVPATVTGKAIRAPQGQQKVLGIRPTVAPRMMVQKVQTAGPAKPGTVGVLTNVSQVKKVGGVFSKTISTQKINQPTSQTQTIHKILSPQSVQKVITPQILKKSLSQKKASDIQVQKRIPIVVSATNSEVVVTQSLPTLQTLQSNVSVASTRQVENTTFSSSQNSILAASLPTTASSTTNLPTLQPTSVAASTGSVGIMAGDQIAQVMAAAPSQQLGDTGAATYVLVTIDDSGALQPYDNSALLTYEGAGQTGEGAPRTLYIDPASLGSTGDLENIILTIDNTSNAGGTVLNLGQALPVNTASSSVFNIGPSHTPASTVGCNQDILAEALANTQVFQPDNTVQDSLTVVNSSQSTVMTPRLLDPSPLLASTQSSVHQTTMLLPSLTPVLPPTNPAGVLETSLTLNQPIMTPLEVPSAVSVLQAPPPAPSSLELPLTITRPALAVSSQSYPSLTSPLPSQTSEQSVPTLSLTINKPMIVSTSSFNPSMPLLSEETDSQSGLDVHVIGDQPTSDPAHSDADVSFHNQEETSEKLDSKELLHREISNQSVAASYSQVVEETLSPKSLGESSSLPSSHSTADHISSYVGDTGGSVVADHSEEPPNQSSGTELLTAVISNSGISEIDHSTSSDTSFSTNYGQNIKETSRLDSSVCKSNSSLPSVKNENISEGKSDDENQTSIILSDEGQLVTDQIVKSETSLSTSYFPISEHVSHTEESITDSSSYKQNLDSPSRNYVQISESTNESEEETSSPYPAKNGSENVTGSIGGMEPQHASQSMPLLTDEPLTINRSSEPGHCEIKGEVQEPSEKLSLEQSESPKEQSSHADTDNIYSNELLARNIPDVVQKSKDQGSLSSESVSSHVMHDDEMDDWLAEFPRARFPSFCAKQTEFKKDDIVWVRVRKIYWPAVITRVDKKKKKAYIRTVNSPRKHRALKIGFKSLIGFGIYQKNKELLERGKRIDETLEDAYIKVKSFLFKKQSIDDLSAVRYLTYDPDDMLYGLRSPLKKNMEVFNCIEDTGYRIESRNEDKLSCSEEIEESSECDAEENVYVDRCPISCEENNSEEVQQRLRDANKLVEIIKTRHCFNHLKKIYHGKIHSARHASFMTYNPFLQANLMDYTGLDIFPPGDWEQEVASKLREYVHELKVKGASNDYMYYVLLPEALLYALNQETSVAVPQSHSLFQFNDG